MDDLTEGFSISVYNVTHSSNQSDAYFLFIDDYEKLKQINITLLIYNETSFVGTNLPSADSPYDTLVKVRTVSKDGTEFMESELGLNNDEANNPFRTRFTASDRMDVRFGQMDGKNGVLEINYQVNVSVLGIGLTFEDVNKTIVVDLNSTITVNSPLSDLNLSRRVSVEG